MARSLSLTETAIRTAKPADKPRKISDGGGLYIQINPNGARYWRYKYRFRDKQKTLALGVYPDVKLAQARKRHREAREQLAAGVDPGAEKKRARMAAQAAAEQSFEKVAREWISKPAPRWSADHTGRVLTSLEADIFPDLGEWPISEVSAPALLATLRKIEYRGALETLSKVHQRCGAIFRYGIATGRCQRDPAADLRGSFTTRKAKGHAALSAAELPESLRTLEHYDGDPQTGQARDEVQLTFVRTGELRGAEWREFDLDKAEWRIPARRMKMDDEHIVPLSEQAIAVLHELEPGDGLVLPSKKKITQPISENTLLYAMYRMGYHGRATVHGLRATASTILNEQGWRPDVIERQLAHAERNKVRAAYNRAEYLPERREMMQHWADYLDGLKRGADVVSIGA